MVDVDGQKYRFNVSRTHATTGVIVPSLRTCLHFYRAQGSVGIPTAFGGTQVGIFATEKKQLREDKKNDRSTSK